MSLSTSGIFTGTSQFSSSFQTAIAKAIQLASLPMQQTQDDIAKLTSQSSELGKLQTQFESLQSALGSLNDALGLGSYSSSATSSVAGATVATVALSGTPGTGSYVVEVIGVGSQATAMSNAGTAVADPAKTSISDGTVYTLTVGASSTTIRPSGSTLSDLAAAINAASAGVKATMVNVGPSAAPDYRLWIQNGELANTALQLAADDGTNPGISLLTAQAPGAAATYRVNGVPASPSFLSSNSAVITLAVGVAVTLLAPGTSTVTVSQNTAAVSSALSSFVNAYNTVLSEINLNRGKDAGALQGQSILMSLRESLSHVADYSTGYSGLSSLTSLGLAFDSAGVLSFDSKAFDTATAGQMQQLATFLGSTTGGGFLKAANDGLAGVTNATGGLIAAQIAAVEKQITSDNQIISVQTDKVTALQTRLTEQMARADAAISALEQQYSYLAQMFQQMQINARNLG